MPKINREEYEVLKPKSEEGYTHIGKSRNGKLQFLQGYIERDMKREQWSDGWGETYMRPVSLFQFIQWEDEEPYSIQELIDEYLDDEYGYFNMKLSREFEEFIKKSEGTEVNKDIEWLKKWVEEYENKITKELGNKFTDDFMTTRLHGGQSAVKEIKYRINQLDEPEEEDVDNETFINRNIQIQYEKYEKCLRDAVEAVERGLKK